MAEEMCAACGAGPVSSFHYCTASACKKAVHGSIICDKVWEPTEMVYFCSQACIEQHNIEIVRTFESVPPADRPDEGPTLVPMRRRPDAAVQVNTMPGVTVLQAHSGEDYEGHLVNRQRPGHARGH